MTTMTEKPEKVSSLPVLFDHDPGIVLRDGFPMVSSRTVAEKFGKRHADVLRAIKNTECFNEVNERNFAFVEYIDSKGESRPECLMTRIGFEILTLGFTGKKALMFRKWYVERFHALEAEHQEVLKRGIPISRAVTDALKKTEPKRFMDKDKARNACINDANLIHHIVLGMDAKHFKKQCAEREMKQRKLKELPKIKDIKKFLTVEQRNAEDFLKKEDEKLIRKGLSFSERKEILKKLHDDRVESSSKKIQMNLSDYSSTLNFEEIESTDPEGF